MAAPKPTVERPEHVAVEARSLREAELSVEGRLLLPGRAAALPGGRVALSISGIEQAAFAITGTMRAVRGGGAGPRIDLEVDEDQRGLLTRILEHVKKGAERPRARAPRLRISMPAVVSTPDGATYMNTFSLSRGGCGLRWSGAAPRVGNAFLIRLGAGFSAPTVRATVCWVREEGSGLRVGFRFVGGQDGHLEALLDTAAGAVATR
jgi:hypothetical protein